MTNFIRNLTYTESVARIAIKAVKKRAAIYRNDITIFQRCVIGYSMYYRIVYRSANAAGKIRTIGIGKTFESRNCPIVANKSLSKCVELPGSNSGSYYLGNLGKCLTY